MSSPLSMAIEKILQKESVRSYPPPSDMQKNLEEIARDYSLPGGDSLVYTLKDSFVIKIMKTGKKGGILLYLDGEVIEYPSDDICQLPIHRHNYLELTYIVRGSLDQVIGERREYLKRGDFSIVDHNSLHYECNWEPDTIVLWLCFSDDFFTHHILSRRQEGNPLDRFIRASLIEQKNSREYITFRPYGSGEDGEELLLKMIQEDQGKDSGYAMMIRILSLRLFAVICKKYDFIITREGTSPRHGNFFFVLDQFIRGNLDRLSVNLLEERFRYGRNFYNRVIRENTGLTYTEYLQKVRLDECRELLLNTELPVCRIIERIGYSNRRHFYELFQQRFGQTPKRYRTLYKI